MTYQHYKLTDTLNIFQKVELNSFKEYMTIVDEQSKDDSLDDNTQQTNQSLIPFLTNANESKKEDIKVNKRYTLIMD